MPIMPRDEIEAFWTGPAKSMTDLRETALAYHDVVKELSEVRGEMSVWKDEALRRRDAQRNADLAAVETIRITMSDRSTTCIRTPSNEIYIHWGGTAVVRADGTVVAVWPEEAEED